MNILSVPMYLGNIAVCLAVMHGTAYVLRRIEACNEGIEMLRANQQCRVILCEGMQLCLIVHSVVKGEMSVQSISRTVGLSAFSGCVLAACIMDITSKRIYRYVWYMTAFPTALLLRVAYRVPDKERLIELMLFILLQQLLFSHMYGRADCHAFCVCAGVITIQGGGFDGYVMHMALSFIILTIDQIAHKNVTASGKLKKPVAMVPYIAVGFSLYMMLRK